MKISSDFSTFSHICYHFDPLAKISAFDSGVFREKNNSANAMIRQHSVRAFERGAGRDHRPNIELKRDVCEVTFDMEDSNLQFENRRVNFYLHRQFRSTILHGESHFTNVRF